MKLFAHRDHRASRAALFDNMDSLEEGGLRSSSSYSSGIDDHDNEKTMDSLHDRVSFLKRVRPPSLNNKNDLFLHLTCMEIWIV